MKSSDIITFTKGIIRKENGEELPICNIQLKTFGFWANKTFSITILKSVWQEIGKIMEWDKK